jgi:ATP-dependent Clp protease ATP-binding subunit ClpA
MNLPGGLDAKVRREVGFVPPTARDIQHRVSEEIRDMLSGAFLSRIGQPVLFAPLDGPTVAHIVARGVEEALHRAAGHLGLGLDAIVVGDEVGPRLTASMEVAPTSSGARLLLEYARQKACTALLALLDETPLPAGQTLYVHADPRGHLTLTT